MLMVTLVISWINLQDCRNEPFASTKNLEECRIHSGDSFRRLRNRFKTYYVVTSCQRCQN